MASFSRLQLAAALLEYDNDIDNPEAPHNRSAHDSAIFAHMRRAQPRPARRATDYLSVALPSDDARVSGAAATINRKSRASTLDALHNPFGPDEHDPEEASAEGDDDMEEMEVDLTSWGLDALMPKDKEKGKEKAKDKSSRKAKERTRSETFAALRAGEPISEFGEQSGNSRSRAMSLGNFGEFGLGEAFLDAESSLNQPEVRPHSLASPDDIVKMMSERPPHMRRASDHALIDKLPHHPPLHSVPFPRTASPSQPDGSTSSRPMSRYALPSQILANLNNQPDNEAEGSSRDRKRSTLSVGSQALLRSDDHNTGAAPRHSRTLSASSRDLLADENNPFAVRPPSPSRMSRFDPKMAARARTASIGSLGSRQMLDDVESVGSERPRDRPYSKWDLMRPKVLVMPSPLQDTLSTGPEPKGRNGFVVSAELPLPPGARASKRGSAMLNTLQPTGVPNPSSAFIPNPRSTMSLSQLTFRNTLMVDGHRDSTYADLDKMLPRATVEGEQAHIPEIEESVAPIEVVVDEPEEEAGKPKRAPGKLYGRSLIDNLEARKQEMRNKQRVYRGDDRPQMMTRTPLRSSTLIDPATLPQRPASKHMDSFASTQSAPALNRRSTGPLLHFDSNGNELPGPAPANGIGQMSKSRSVFGVDTIWERELAKLREMEAMEMAEAQAEEAKTGKGKEKVASPLTSPSLAPASPIATQHVTAAAPVLPTIQKVTTARRPPVNNDQSDSESDSGDEQPAAKKGGQDGAGWGSSDDEGPRRPPVSALSPARSQGRGPIPRMAVPEDSDSEEDVPLVATIGRVAQRMGRSRADSDSDEDKPLTAILNKPSKDFLNIDFDRPASIKAPASAKGGADDDEDEQPLGLRASTMFGSVPKPSGGEDEDDVPLALHPDQQRRTQYQMLAQQQQQQQMMMMMQAQQAQMQMQMMTGSMYMGGPPSVMGSGFFNPAMAQPMMMAPPPSAPSPPPIHDAAKYGRVDRWRHDVAVEGDKS